MIRVEGPFSYFCYRLTASNKSSAYTDMAYTIRALKLNDRLARPLEIFTGKDFVM